MKEKIFKIILTSIFGLLFAVSSFAHGGVEDGHQKTSFIDDIVGEIRLEQKVESNSAIDCKKVTDKQFENLGDSVMDIVHQGKEHEFMDKMMGGEGSESLRQMHVNMGKSYNEC